MVHNASGNERMKPCTMNHNQAVFDTRTLVLKLPRAGIPVFRAYWPVENGLLETEVGESAWGCVCG